MRAIMYVVQVEPIAALVEGEPVKLVRVMLSPHRPPNADGTPHEPIDKLPPADPDLVSATGITLALRDDPKLAYGQPIVIELYTLASPTTTQEATP